MPCAIFLLFTGQNVKLKSKLPSSIENIREPVSNVTATEKFKSIFNTIKDESVYILQCYGVHGSGKSQTALQLARKFPYFDSEDQNQLIIKYQIECSDSERDVKTELQTFAENLQRCGYISKDKVYDICGNLDKNLSGPLVNVLLNDCEANVLLLIEDPEDTDKQLLSDLYRKLHAKFCHNRKFKLHLYITCRKEDQILAKEERNILHSELMTGFSEDESVSFLNEAEDCVTDTDAARQIAVRFSGLPLGLQAARGYCVESQITYDEYLTLVQHNEVDLEESEKRMIENLYGPNAEHVFQAIVMPFFPNSGAATETKLHWNILSCLSYFHHDSIPRVLLERCCYMFFEESLRNLNANIKANTGQLITKLMNLGMCLKLNKHELLFHQVVLNAFRVKHKAREQKSTFIKKAIEVMCSLVSKDLRQKADSVKMTKFRPHLQSLLKYVGIAHETLDSNEPDFYLYKALLSHLYEVTATIMSGGSSALNEESNQYFYKALNLLWDESDQFISGEFIPTNYDVETLANTIITLSQKKAEKLLPENFVVAYASKLYYCFDKNLLESTCGNNFDIIKQTFEAHNSKEQLIKRLQECNLFLADSDYRSVFFAERLAAIFHSWSRALLYADPKRIQEDKKSEWLSSLSRNVSIQCKLKFKVHLLNEWISLTTGLIPILLKQRGSDYLNKVLNLCVDALSRKDLMRVYENGVKKEDMDPSQHMFSRISLLRSLVRANARLEHLNDTNCYDKDHRCVELVELSWQNKKYTNSSTCMIYCAKYFAARKKYVDSMDCFRRYFAMIEEHDPKFLMKCWAIYNYARAVCNNDDACIEDREDAMRKCEEVLQTNEVMTENLDRLIQNCLDMLRNYVAQ